MSCFLTTKRPAFPTLFWLYKVVSNAGFVLPWGSGWACVCKREWVRNIRPIEWIRPRETIMPMMIGTSLSLGHFYQSSLQSTWAGNDAPAQVAWLKGWPAWYNWITSILKILSRLGYFLSLASNQLLHENQGLIFGSHILRITPRLHRCCMKWVWQLWDLKRVGSVAWSVVQVQLCYTQILYMNLTRHE